MVFFGIFWLTIFVPFRFRYFVLLIIKQNNDKMNTLESTTQFYPFRYVSRKQLEKILDASQDFVSTKMRQGVFKPKYIGRKPYFDLREIERMLEDQE